MFHHPGSPVRRVPSATSYYDVASPSPSVKGSVARCREYAGPARPSSTVQIRGTAAGNSSRGQKERRVPVNDSGSAPSEIT
eukprot:67835-Hanusia_phi.AAC.2